MTVEKTLGDVFAPFDAKAWERFREFDPAAAASLVTVVEAGITPEAMAGYGRTNGYSEGTINWLLHAAAYLRREREAAGPRRLTDAEPPSFTVRGDTGHWTANPAGRLVE